jgi:hypothetical protein
MEEVEGVMADGRVGDFGVAAQAEAPDVGRGGSRGAGTGPAAKS